VRLQYSHGGHLLLVASGSTIYLLDALTLHVQHTFMGNVAVVHAIRWAEDDTMFGTCMVSCGLVLSSLTFAFCLQSVRFHNSICGRRWHRVRMGCAFAEESP